MWETIWKTAGRSGKKRRNRIGGGQGRRHLRPCGRRPGRLGPIAMTPRTHFLQGLAQRARIVKYGSAPGMVHLFGVPASRALGSTGGSLLQADRLAIGKDSHERRAPMMAQPTKGECQLALAMLIALAFCGLCFAGAGQHDPLGAQGWLVLLLSIAVIFGVISQYFEPEPDDSRLRQYPCGGRAGPGLPQM